MPNEPIRGSLPDPSFHSLSGLELLRAYMRGLFPAVPLIRLFQMRNTQAASGTYVGSQLLSPWFGNGDGVMDLAVPTELALWCAAATGTPPATEIRTSNLSMRFLRPCDVDSGPVIARSRILYAGSRFITVEAGLEDGIGRGLIQATASVRFRPVDAPPPPISLPLEPVEQPVYATPDPPRRPMPPGDDHLSGSTWRALACRGGSLPDAEDLLLSPISRLLGIRAVEVAAGRARVAMPASEWVSLFFRQVNPGVIVTMGYTAMTMAIATVAGPEERHLVTHGSATFLAPVPVDGQELVAEGRVRHKGEVTVVDADVTESGEIVAILQMTGVLAERRGGTGRTTTERLLLTVLFTDLVGSTEQAERLGDAGWRPLLEKHDALIRRELATFRGREVKTTGDGFLATFDSPSRALACARVVRDAVSGLGLELRVGIHTGECEVMGVDVGGVAVHLASRIQATAEPGQILVSQTVRDLVSGSGVHFLDRGVHKLKGLEEEHRLFAVEG